MIITPALKLRRYCFSGNVSNLIFSEDKFQQELYHQLKTDYKKLCLQKESHHKSLDLCCITGGLISYGELDLIKDFIYNHPLYSEEEQIFFDEHSSRGYSYILLNSVIRLFPVYPNIEGSNWAVKMQEFDFWINNNLSSIKWNEEQGRYVFYNL